LTYIGSHGRGVIVPGTNDPFQMARGEDCAATRWLIP
jgi:hypothetical protein